MFKIALFVMLSCYAWLIPLDIACSQGVDHIEISSSNTKYGFTLIATKTFGLKGLVISKNGIDISNFLYFFQGSLINGVLSLNSGDYIAINNRHSKGGDYVWIFSLSSGGAIKQPDNENIILLCSNIASSYPKYSRNCLVGEYTFAYRWTSMTKLSVCNILISKFDHAGILVVYDTYTMGKYGGFSITDRKVEALSSQLFKELPAMTTSIWSGWNSAWWQGFSTTPAAK